MHEKRTVGTDAQFTENMKDDGQSRKEAINLMTEPISSKESSRIGTWNVRTMNESTKTAQIALLSNFFKNEITCIYSLLGCSQKNISSFIFLQLKHPMYSKT